MSRPLQLMHLTLRLNTAADEGNWEALAKLDREVASALPTLAELGTWTNAERRMLADLAEAHAKARRRCSQEARRLGEILTDMRASREGWIAYGTSEEFGDTNP